MIYELEVTPPSSLFGGGPTVSAVAMTRDHQVSVSIYQPYTTYRPTAFIRYVLAGRPR